ncbi:hypothetical protein EIN_419360 [Entamoeba invadens IP1]|uniref:Uncharacterized protein n=1 Tax=Entamoeba invadens IP1 TaxID=370355 RepID=A0A0A1U573_ENTIV|nr:hypothetical protein EIN_419360 [Entamoeba invadens IP1]ELP88007.1 hypothetical protein EIN_419360 [Entamoeba invadens IP1]|eukprot:XP_004254778.1 hypothetical protein EIN_419360 [Entamoeba invadens IP1]
MKVQGLLLFVIVLVASAQSSGFWTPTLYKVQERIGELSVRIEEVEDAERHIEDQIDIAIRDLKHSVTKKQKYIIGRRLSHLRSKLVVLNTQKLAILRGLRRVVKRIPLKYRKLMIRKLKLEKRFNQIREVSKDATALLQPKYVVHHKASTKRTLKNLGHGLADKVKTIGKK